MGKLGKILAPIVAVLAIVVAVFSYLVFEGFKKYQARANVMAKGLVETAAKLDSQTGTGTSGKVTFTAAAAGAKESGTLAYAEYKANASGFEGNANSVSALAGTVIAQRNALADSVSEMCITLGVAADDIAADDIKNAGQYSAKLALAAGYAKEYKARDDKFADAIDQIAAILGAGSKSVAKQLPVVAVDEDGNAVVKAAAVAGSLDAVIGAVKDAKARSDAYEKALRGAAAIINNYKWKSDIARISKSNYASVLPKVAEDFNEINKALDQFNALKSELAQTQAELKERENEISSLKKKIAAQEKTIAAQFKKLEDYGLAGEERPDIESIDQINQNITGTVLRDNRDWNYVVIDLGSKDVFVGVNVVIADNAGKYIASGKVVKIEDTISQVEISRRVNGAAIEKGYKVFIGTNESAKADDADAEADEDEEDEEEEDEE